MMAAGVKYEFTEYLDRERRNILFVKFILSQDHAEVLGFVVSQLITLKGRKEEIVRFDGSFKERVNVHKFYLKPAEKQYLDNDISYETLELFKAHIRKNWHMYAAKYFERITGKVI